MGKQIKVFLGIIGAVFIACGLLFIFCPGGSLSTVTWIAGLIMLLSGLGTMFFFLSPGKILVFSWAGFLNGLVTSLFGFLFMKNTSSVSNFFIVIYGILLICIGIFTMISSILARKVGTTNAWAFILAFGVIAFLLGIISISSPSVGGALITIPVGLGLLAIGAGYIAVDIKMIQANKTGNDDKYYRDLT